MKINVIQNFETVKPKKTSKTKLVSIIYTARDSGPYIHDGSLYPIMSAGITGYCNVEGPY